MPIVKWSEKRKGIHLPLGLTKLTTEPNQEAYWWHGRNSILGTISIFLILIIRVSPLQIIKSLYRSIGNSKSPLEQERRDFHTIYTEIYFIILSVFSAFLLKIGENVGSVSSLPLQSFYTVILTWFLLEAVGWVLYYSFYRILIERNFSIFSLSEYLVSIPVVIAYQLVLVCLLYNKSLGSVLQNFFQFGATKPDTADFIVAALRTVYLSLIIAYIVSLYPKMKIKTVLDFVSIGEGGAYSKYYKQAISQIRNSSIRACSPAGGKINEFFDWFVRYSSKHNQIYIVSTPTPSHFSYINHLSNIGRNFYIEKPIVSNVREIDILAQNFDKFFGRAFFLQYYVLEKALALTYLFHPLPEYEEFLRVGDGKQKFGPGDRERILYAFTTLGRMKSVTIKILEGHERSKHDNDLHWTEARSSGGMLLDLGIHAFSLLRVVSGTNGKISDLFVEHYTDAQRLETLNEIDRNNLAPTLICATGLVQNHLDTNLSFCIEIGKHVASNRCKRFLTANFERGALTCDFDAECLVISAFDYNFTDEVISSCTVPAGSEGIQKLPYYGMFVLGVKQFDGEWGYRADMPHVQLAALRDVFVVEQAMASRNALMKQSRINDFH